MLICNIKTYIYYKNKGIIENIGLYKSIISIISMFYILYRENKVTSYKLKILKLRDDFDKWKYQKSKLKNI